jgi:hypothetical protein
MKTLAEAAAEVLNKSRNSGGMTFQKSTGGETVSGVSNPLSTVVDLGGATYENPAGDKTGSKAAAARPQASAPKGPEKSGDQNFGGLDVDKRVGVKDAHATSNVTAGAVSSPDKHDGAHGADHGEYAHPTMEEVQLTEEEKEEQEKNERESAKAERRERIAQKMKKKQKSVKEDMDALFTGENLSEEFKTKAATIFEAAVLGRALDVVEELEEEILDAAEEALNDSKLEIEEQVDTYLNFVVENWVKENQVAIESGLRSEIVEDFITGLKNLFAEHYVDVPAEKVDVVTQQAEEITALNKKINDTLDANAQLTKKLGESKRNEILASVCEGLTATQAEKLKTLAEGVEFTTEGEYTGKLKVLSESYFTGKTVKQDNTSKVIALTESEAPAQLEEEISPAMAQYVKALNRTQTF